MVEKSKNPMTNVIEEGLQGIYKSHDALARTWRVLLYETRIQPHQWHQLLDKWQLRNQSEQYVGKSNKPTKQKMSWKGNITRRLSKEKISWSCLMTGLSILGYEKMEIDIKLFRRGKTRTMTITVDDLANHQDDQFGDNDD